MIRILSSTSSQPSGIGFYIPDLQKTFGMIIIAYSKKEPLFSDAVTILHRLYKYVLKVATLMASQAQKSVTKQS